MTTVNRASNKPRIEDASCAAGSSWAKPWQRIDALILPGTRDRQHAVKPRGRTGRATSQGVIYHEHVLTRVRTRHHAYLVMASRAESGRATQDIYLFITLARPGVIGSNSTRMAIHCSASVRTGAAE